MILDALTQHLNDILDRIRPSYLERYRILRDCLQKTDVSLDPQYQRTFNGFYKMQRRRADWYSYYFSLLERTKTEASLDFEDIIRQIKADTGRVEPSFASKLVATVRPEMPVYDKYVRENLTLLCPSGRSSGQAKVDGFIKTYRSLVLRVATMIAEPLFADTLKPAFDERFPAYTSFTDVKKLDFLLWQHRLNSPRPNPGLQLTAAGGIIRRRS